MKTRTTLIIFGEGNDTNIHELQKLLDDGYHVVHSCSMPSSISTTVELKTSFYEPQCLVILEKDV